jgi:hypothetical protein
MRSIELSDGLSLSLVAFGKDKAERSFTQRRKGKRKAQKEDSGFLCGLCVFLSAFA